MKRLNIVIPMAGAGKRFKDAGYDLPKPLIDVNGMKMIDWVCENFFESSDHELHFIFIIQQSHDKKFSIINHFKNFTRYGEIEPYFNNKNIDIIAIDGLTEGAACTVLKARDLIDNDDELIIANSDQYLQWDFQQVLDLFQKYDGGIVSVYSNSPKWSYVKLDENGLVTQLKEKEVISEYATVGVYYFKHGKDFVKGADDMIHKNVRTNNEFYVAPVYNILINSFGCKIINYPIPNPCFHGLGTPEDLDKFLAYINGISYNK